nr:hypothetical protein [Ectobacillus panaciterrae]
MNKFDGVAKLKKIFGIVYKNTKLNMQQITIKFKQSEKGDVYIAFSL